MTKTLNTHRSETPLASTVRQRVHGLGGELDLLYAHAAQVFLSECANKKNVRFFQAHAFSQPVRELLDALYDYSPLSERIESYIITSLAVSYSINN